MIQCSSAKGQKHEMSELQSSEMAMIDTCLFSTLPRYKLSIEGQFEEKMQ